MGLPTNFWDDDPEPPPKPSTFWLGYEVFSALMRVRGFPNPFPAMLLVTPGGKTLFHTTTVPQGVKILRGEVSNPHGAGSEMDGVWVGDPDRRLLVFKDITRIENPDMVGMTCGDEANAALTFMRYFTK